MKNLDIYKDIAERTDGDIYVGVVGPVRTGKSTFIKKFMELLVLPNIDNEYKRERAIDELPQSAAGKTIMTTEPKFIPNEAVEITIARGDDSGTVARKLQNAGLVENASEYDAYLMQHGYDKKIRVGSVTIPTDSTWQEIADYISGRR